MLKDKTFGFLFMAPKQYMTNILSRVKFLFIFAFLLISIASSEEKDVSIIKSDENGITFEYTPIYSKSSVIENGSEKFQEYKFSGEVYNSKTLVGSPIEKFRNITLRFPGLTNNVVEILTADYEEIQNVLIAPVPTIEVDKERNFTTKYIKDVASYRLPSFIPEEVVALNDLGVSRNAVLGNILIYPLQYNPVSKTLRKYSRVRVQVTFGSKEYQSGLKMQDELLAGVGLNYETAKNWFVSSPSFKKKAQYNSVLASGVWFKFPVTEDGIYKIDGTRLLSLGFPSSTNPATIKIYSNGGIELPLDPTANTPDDLLENAIYLYDGGTQGTLDAADYILFYGKSTRGWNYNSSTKKFSHYINRYTETNYYWLTYDGLAGKKMNDLPSLNEVNVFQPGNVKGKVFREDEKINVLSSGMEWLGQQFSANDVMTYVVPLHGLDVQNPIEYNIRLAARTHLQRSYFTIYEHQQIIGSTSIEGTFLGSYTSPQARFANINVSKTPNFTDTHSELKLSFTSDNSAGIGNLDWFEIFYLRTLTAQADAISFHTHDTTAIIKYSIGGFSSNDIKVFYIQSFDQASVIPQTTILLNTVAFQLVAGAGTVGLIYAVGPNGYKSPSAFTRINNQNIHGAVSSGDSLQLIIIVPGEFKNAANRLKSHRESLGNDKLKTLVADVDEIYNEFGCGMSSPVAIRNFLKFAYSSSPAQSLKYALLFGDGDFDYKRITISGTNWIPPWETPESYVDINSYATEDPFAIFDNGGRVSMAVGRLAVRSQSEAEALVDKIIEYEKNPVRDPWKMRVTFVADDGPAAPGDDDRDMHTSHAEDVARMTPNFIEKRKIYIVEYPTVVTSAGRRKPTANEAIIRQMNEGTLFVNFSGHGNPRLWTHEQIFVRETDFQLLQNKGKYFYLIAATCNFSEFDAGGDQSGGEILTNKANSGAIGVLSATRAVYAFPNRQLNVELYRQTFKYDAYGQLLPQRLGDAIYKTKQIYTDPNAQKFFLLGDPSTRIALPQKFGAIDSINGQFTDKTVSVKALQKVNLKGVVTDSGSVSNLNGKAQIVMYDANRSVLIPEWSNFKYTVPGGVIFKGENSISSGKFSSEFIIPKDISYDTLNGRITLYFANDQTDGMGYTENIVINGTDTSAAKDEQGPELNIYFNSHSFRPGDVVPEAPLLILDLKDESGINAAGSGIGHRIEAWLDDQNQSIDLTPFYKSKLDTYQEGTVEYQFGKLNAGTHSLKLRAWDVFNNASTSETIFDVLVSQGLTISEVFNYPNPFSNQTYFTFNHNQILPVDAEVKVYTIAGRQVNSLKQTNITDKFVKIEWDGRDKEGDRLANGVYLYKVILKTQDGRFTSEALGKLSLLK